MFSDKLVFKVPQRCDGWKLGSFLKRECGVSARMITRLKREKDGIIRNEKNIRTVDRVSADDVIVLNLPEDSNDIVPTEGVLSILYEDGYLLVVDKPAGMPVHPAKVHQSGTLANILKFRQLEKGENYTFRAVNRLDKDTSGIVLIAKNSFVAKELPKNVQKTYLAVCEGVLSEPDIIDSPIRLLEGHSIQRTTAPDGAPAVTHYTPIRNNGTHTLLSLTLETGRTHQIRCHMASIGHPLAGDDMYGGSLDFIPRQALHCASVVFTHPVTSERVELESPLPKDIAAII